MEVRIYYKTLCSEREDDTHMLMVSVQWVCPNELCRRLFGFLYCPIHGRLVFNIQKGFALSDKKRKHFTDKLECSINKKLL